MKTILLFFVLFISTQVFAQNPSEGPREELLKVKMEKFMELLQVDSETAIKYFKAAQENRKAINKLNKKRANLMDDIESNLDAADLGSKLDQMEDIELSIANQRISFLNELKTILTPKQIAQAIILEKKFGKKLKEEIGKRKGEE